MLKKMHIPLVVVLLLLPITLWANHSTLRNDTFNTLPDSQGGAFRTDSRIMWGHEEAQREGRYFSAFIFSGGIHPISSTLTSPAFATEAFVPERVNQVSTAITYAALANDVCWTIISSDNNGITGWTRVGSTSYYFQCQGNTTPSRPTLPSNSAFLMEILIASSAITTVTDISARSPISSSAVPINAYNVITQGGAACNGIHDDTPQITASIASGRSIIIPPGVTCIVTGVTKTGLSNFTIMGGGTLKLKAETHARVLSISSSSDFSILGVTFDGNKANQTGATDRINDSLAVIDSKRFLLQGNTFKNGYSGTCLLVSNSVAPTGAVNQETNAIIAHNIVKDCGNPGSAAFADGIFAWCDNCEVHDNTILNVTDTGIAMDYSKNIRVHHNVIRGDPALVSAQRPVQGIAILGVTNAIVESNTVEWTQIGITVTLSGNPPVAPYVSAYVTMAYNTVLNTASTLYSGDAISAADPSTNFVRATSNTVVTATRGVVVTPNDSVISHNSVFSTVGRGIYVGGGRSKALNNLVVDAGGDGIYVQDDGIEVRSNTIINASNGIDCATKLARVSGNFFSGVTTPLANATKINTYDDPIILPNAIAYKVKNIDGSIRDILLADTSDRTRIELNGLQLVISQPSTALTVGAAGGAAALPATPTGYIRWLDISNNSWKIPYYAE